METATISCTFCCSFQRMPSSTAISSNGFIDILTLSVSTPEPSDFTRILTWKSTTRLIATNTFTRKPPTIDYAPSGTYKFLIWIFHIERRGSSMCRQREGLLFEGRRDQGG